MTWTSSNVSAGDDVLATDHNTLRADLLDVFEKAPPIGSIVMWAGGSGDVPSEWQLCDGSAINRTTYSDLYTLVGNTFGSGNGSTTFNVPDMRDRFVIGAGSSYSRNSKGGSASVTLTNSQMPSHTHSGPSHRHSVSLTSSTNNVNHTHEGAGGMGVFNSLRWQTTGVNYNFIRSDPNGSTTITAGNSVLHTHSVSGNTGYAGTGSTGSTGSGSAHENRPPYIGILYIIKVL